MHFLPLLNLRSIPPDQPFLPGVTVSVQTACGNAGWKLSIVKEHIPICSRLQFTGPVPVNAQDDWVENHTCNSLPFFPFPSHSSQGTLSMLALQCLLVYSLYSTMLQEYELGMVLCAYNPSI